MITSLSINRITYFLKIVNTLFQIFSIFLRVLFAYLVDFTRSVQRVPPPQAHWPQNFVRTTFLKRLLDIFLTSLSIIEYITNYRIIQVGMFHKILRSKLCNITTWQNCGAHRSCARPREKGGNCFPPKHYKRLSCLFRGTGLTLCPTLLDSPTSVRGFHCSSKPLSDTVATHPCHEVRLLVGHSCYYLREVSLTLTPRPPNRLSRSIP